MIDEDPEITIEISGEMQCHPKARIKQMQAMGAVEFRVPGATASGKSTRLAALAQSARDCGAHILDQYENPDGSESLWLIPHPTSDI